MAAINKSFVIKNGLEVNTNLIFADAPEGKVGIGTTNPEYLLHVKGGIGATDSFVSGISTTGVLHVGTAGTVITATAAGSVGLGTTNPQYKLQVIGGIGVTDSFVTGVSTVLTTLRVGTGGTVLTVLGAGNSIGIGTASPAFLLDIRSPVSTGQTALYVQGDVRITGDLSVDDITFDEASLTNLYVSGIGTIVNGFITNLTGTAGTITTFNSTSGTITNLTGTAGTITTFNSTNGTITNLNVTGISTLGTVKISSGIITATSGIVTYYGDGNFLNLTSNPSRGIGIGTTGGVVGYAVTFINFKGAGVSTTQYNSNTGIATIFFEGGGGGGGSISISTTAPVSPGSGDLWYSPDYGRTFIYYDESVVGYGTDAFWVDAAPFNVGIITSLSNVSFSLGSAAAPSMFFIGDQQTGFFSPGIGQFTVVSSGSSVLNVNASGINVTGVITATSFVGNGSGLTGAGSTVFNNTTTNQEFFPLFTATTSGTITASGISTSKLTYNPSTGAMTAVDFNSTSDINLKENIHTVGNALEITEQLRGVSFDWKETGRSSYGVIAQELEKVLPELVTQGDIKSVNYNGIIGVLIEAIKELKKEVEDLKNTK